MMKRPRKTRNITEQNPEYIYGEAERAVENPTGDVKCDINVENSEKDVLLKK